MATAFARLRAWIGVYLANHDALAEGTNTGAFLVWSSQPLYPLYVWLLAGAHAWPALLTWLSTPMFAGVPFVARKSSIAGRALFVIAGVGNTLVSLRAFGPDAGIIWFLIPCLVIAIGFFRPEEWMAASALAWFAALAVIAQGLLGGPMAAFTEAELRSLSHLNEWSAAVLTAYLIYAAVRAHRRDRQSLLSRD